jgi:pimeloyl-ACP methyl ester carboxylesterase
MAPDHGGASRRASVREMQPLTARTEVLDIVYEAHGPVEGPVVFLLHGFPYDPRCYDEVAPKLAADGCRVLVPYLRGYGGTRFRVAETPRSGEQAACVVAAL